MVAQAMIEELRKNCAENNITFLIPAQEKGIVHIVGPSKVLPTGTTIACGDSHTSTHGALVPLPLEERVKSEMYWHKQSL